MAVAELFIGAFITVLFEKLASGDLIRLAQSAGIYSELNKWNDTLTHIRSVLVDAGQKHIRDIYVQTWLNKLQHLAYEIDDVLDDLTTEAMRLQLNQETSSSISRRKEVLNIIPAKFHALKYGRKMSSKLEAITTELRELVEKIQFLGDKEALLLKLLSNESSSRKFSVVSIVGMGGIGKTTLARIFYNDEKVKDHFELMSWVCVSDDFDIFNITKAILKDVGGDGGNFETLNQLQLALSEKLSKKRFLLVLDDVWNENYDEWEILQRPFAAGSPGSVILLTTRKTMVASMMGSDEPYPLELLTDEEAVSLFSQHALDKQNFDSHPTLKLLGEGIVKKCGGLPLALRTLGRVMRSKPTHEEWEDLLNSEIWDSKVGNKILPALRLSYYDLPPNLKQMFAYCCLFPKDYMFDKDELVLLWMAEGFLYESNSKKSMESLGRECFEELVLRSFFQLSTIDKSRYMMHDLMNDLTLSVAGEFFIMLGDKNESFEKYHHLSFIHEKYEVYRKFKPLERARRLRTFFPVSIGLQDGLNYFFLSNMVLVKLLPQLQFLRVLSLANYQINEIPKSIGGLKHLRYLNFSNTNISCLPKQVGELYNLQSLLLSGCHQLTSLPNSIVKLINLRHLDISDTPMLNKLPLGIGGLTNLQTLSKVIIGEANGLKISDLKGLLHLRDQLSIKGLHKVINAVQAKEVNLHQKRGLVNLEMEWSNIFNDSRNEILEFEVLEGLTPYDKLRSLKILYYMGLRFPSWVGDASFVCLTQLTLCGCRNCTCLPTLGHLPSLKMLFIASMDGLERLGSELLGPPNSCDGVVFPSLEVLEFTNMLGWVEWSSGGAFPSLNRISIINCPKLDVVEIELISSLRVLCLQGCSVAVLTSMVRASSSITSLKLKDIKGLAQLRGGEFLEHLKAVEYLDVSECDELTYLWESEAEACKILVSLQKLEVSWCKHLASLGEKKVGLLISMESLREVEIRCCPRFTSYNCPNHVEKLMISYCDSITSLTFPIMHEHDHPRSTLKALVINSCDNLDINSFRNNLFLSALELLEILNKPDLVLFPKGCVLHLTYLTIWGCHNIKSIPGNGFLCLRSLWIGYCENLKSFSHEHLQSLASLEEMVIIECPSMDDSFPCGKWPPYLRRLRIGGLKKPISEWGVQNFPTSLVFLILNGENSRVVSFAKAEEEEMRNTTTCSSSFLLPSSLTSLEIANFKELESVSKGMQHLTCLEHLEIWECPKLRDLPETLLPSLSSLKVYSPSPQMRKKCKRRKGRYWPIISQIPFLRIY